uniref:Uncharacterized protein n=1 Tax=viral metagenome TaxID=1070528 RepID=A0A6M3L534_9ZZZZ
MIEKQNGHWKPDWSAIITAIVIIATIVAMHYTAIGELNVKRTVLEGRVGSLEMQLELRLKSVDITLASMDKTLDKLETKLDEVRMP